MKWGGGFGAPLVAALLLYACGGGGDVDSGTSTGGGAGSGGATSGGTGAATSGGTGGATSGGAGGASGTGATGSGGTSGAGGSTASCKSTLPAPTYVDPKSAKEIAIVGDPGAPGGIFDPSVEYPLNAPAGAMSYSRVVASNDIQTRIAVSNDQGKTWTFVAEANQSKPITVTVPPTSTRCPGGTCSGRLVHEVSSLVYDPDDADASRRWKLFTTSYVVLGKDQLAYDLGYIGLFTAAEPHLAWKDEGKAIGWKSESTFSSENAGTNASLFPALADCALLTEPDVMWRPGGLLELAIGCAKVGSPPTIRIELLRSLDHGKTFLYAGRLLEANDAFCLGGTVPQVNAAELFRVQGKSYLIATPAGPTPVVGTGYRGCFVFELATGGTGVVRDAAGAPVVTRLLDSPDGRFTGACSVAEGASAAGYLVSEASLDAPPKLFHVFASGTPAP